MQRLERGTYLGGQQIAAVLGHHPYMSIGDVFARSLWGDDGVSPDAPQIRRGRIVEPGLLDEAMRIDEIPRERFARDHFAVDSAVPYFAGTCDGVLIGDDGYADTIYEVTSTSRFSGSHLWGPTETEQAAPYKWIQAQWYMGILGARRARIFCLFVDDDDLREYTIPRADDAIVEMRVTGEQFWLEHVLTKLPPPPEKFATQGLDPLQVSAVLDRLYRAAPDGLEITMTPALAEARARYVAARDAMNAWEEEKARAAAEIKLIMQDATSSRAQGLGSITWSPRKVGSAKLDTDAVLSALVEKYKIPAADLDALKAAHTTPAKVARVLNVR
jgi:hypothetical protein